jgi:hypothetical protein
VRYTLRYYCLVAILLAGCSSSVDNPLRQDCLSQPRYIFNIFGNWLHAGTTFFDISDPSAPAMYGKYSYSADTLFTIGQTEYVLSGYSVNFDSLPKPYFEKSNTLTAVLPAHIAALPQTLFLLRHNAFSTSATCAKSVDSINALETDGLSGASDATLLDRISLTDPQDITINGSTLYVLDGAAGLKIFSLADPKHPSLVTTNAAIQGYHMDVTNQSTLIVHTINGLMQYDLSNPTAPALLGKLQ